MMTTTASARRLTPILVVLAAVSIAGALAASVAAAPEPEEKPVPKGAIEDLAWLAGTWTGAVGPGTWEAVYTTPSGGEVLSTNKEIRGNRVVSFEFERFFRQGEAIVMTPYVKGVKSVAFTMTTSDPKARKAVFENPKHDFPQRIVYWLEGGKLNARAEATRDGRTQGLSWSWDPASLTD